MIKKFVFSIALALASNLGFATASAELFQIDEAEIKTEFAQLEELEAFVSANEGVTYSSMDPNDALLTNFMNPAANPSGFLGATDGPLGINSFLWGFCPSFVPYFGCLFGAGGVLFVYLDTEDSDETKRALYGYIAGIGVQILIILAIFFATGASSLWLY
jgi:hypothetical protein